MPATTDPNKINLNILKGQSVGVVGKTGVGKSTFINLFTGLLVPTAGEIIINNKIMSGGSKILHNILKYMDNSIFTGFFGKSGGGKKTRHKKYKKRKNTRKNK